MSTGNRGFAQLCIALVTPPSDVDYGASVATAIAEHTTNTTIDRYDPTVESARSALADHHLVIVCGSTTRVADSDPWIAELATTIRALVADGTPVLGVCFGHQLLAESLDGTVDSLPHRAAGYRDIERPHTASCIRSSVASPASSHPSSGTATTSRHFRRARYR